MTILKRMLNQKIGLSEKVNDYNTVRLNLDHSSFIHLSLNYASTIS